MATESASRALACAFAVLAGAGCPAAVENPPAYDDERFLCTADREGEWQAELERCREAYETDESCGGLISFTGRIEGKDVTVDSRITGNEFVDLLMDDGSTLRDKIVLNGASPYFLFSLQWRQLGGDLLGGADDQVLDFGVESDPDVVLRDELVRPSLRMTVGAESRAFAFPAGSLTIERQQPEEEIASFEAEFAGSDDSLRGCFHAFPLTHRLAHEANYRAGD